VKRITCNIVTCEEDINNLFDKGGGIVDGDYLENKKCVELLKCYVELRNISFLKPKHI